MKTYPYLAGTVRMMLQELHLGDRWDVVRVEEVSSNYTTPSDFPHSVPDLFTWRVFSQVVCDSFKIVVGLGIAKSVLRPAAALQGFYDEKLARGSEETSTGWPPEPARCDGVLATWVGDDGGKLIREANVAHCEATLEGYEADGQCSFSPQGGTAGGSSSDVHGCNHRALQQARELLRKAEEEHAQALIDKVQSRPHLSP